VVLYFLGAKIFMAIFAEGATRMMLDGAGTDLLFSCPLKDWLFALPSV